MENTLYSMERAHFDHQRQAHWDEIARKPKSWGNFGGDYHRRLTNIYQFAVPSDGRVLEIGCGAGDLLAALSPRHGVGVDFSAEMIQLARQKHPKLTFLQMDAHSLALDGVFDVVILSDLLNDVWDVQAVFQQVARYITPDSRVIINSYSRLWEGPLALVEKLKLAKPLLNQNWLTVEDIQNLLYLSGFEVIRTWSEILWPLNTPLVANFLNKVVVRLWPFNHLALTNFVIARLKPQASLQSTPPSVSVIIPARNEAGNIAQIIARTPEMGRGTELVFVEGHSKDDTLQTIRAEIEKHPQRNCRLMTQTGMGKGDAVRMGFANATGDILMILDADMTVPPEDLRRFYAALASGQADFVNGVRLVYPMADQAMQALNFVGNKFFSMAFTWLLGQPIKDTLCGTKVLRATDYARIVANRAYFGEFDPFGDFDLLFGAAKLNLKIVDLPIRYGSRTYGTTNIQRWKHGWLLLRMVAFAASRIKFV